MSLQEYINQFFNGNKAEFGRACGVIPQQVTKWIAMGCIVVDGVMYSPRREVPKS